jgi:hypothetical protein
MLFFIIVSCKASWRDVDYHRQLQEQVSYEARMKSNIAFSKKNARQSLKNTKKELKKNKKIDRHQESIEKIYQKIEQRKTKN